MIFNDKLILNKINELEARIDQLERSKSKSLTGDQTKEKPVRKHYRLNSKNYFKLIMKRKNNHDVVSFFNAHSPDGLTNFIKNKIADWQANGMTKYRTAIVLRLYDNIAQQTLKGHYEIKTSTKSDKEMDIVIGKRVLRNGKTTFVPVTLY